MKLALALALAICAIFRDATAAAAEQKDLVAIDKGTGAVETAALQDNTVNECPPSDNPGARECSVQCERLCTDFLRVECCYEQGGVCFCDTRHPSESRRLASEVGGGGSKRSTPPPVPSSKRKVSKKTGAVVIGVIAGAMAAAFLLILCAGCFMYYDMKKSEAESSPLLPEPE